MKSFFIQKLNSKRKYKVSYLKRWVNRYIWNAACRSNVTLRQMKRTHNLMKHFVFSFFDQGCQVVIAGSALIGSPALIFSREVAASRWDQTSWHLEHLTFGGFQILLSLKIWDFVPKILLICTSKHGVSVNKSGTYWVIFTTRKKKHIHHLWYARITFWKRIPLEFRFFDILIWKREVSATYLKKICLTLKHLYIYTLCMNNIFSLIGKVGKSDKIKKSRCTRGPTACIMVWPDGYQGVSKYDYM